MFAPHRKQGIHATRPATGGAPFRIPRLHPALLAAAIGLGLGGRVSDARAQTPGSPACTGREVLVDSGSARISTSGGDIEVRAAGWGPAASTRPPAAATPHPAACVGLDAPCVPSVAIERGALTEYWEDQGAVLEHALVLAQAPRAADFVLEIEVTGAAPHVLGATEAVLVASDGSFQRYGGLRAWDRSGGAVSARFSPGDTGLRIHLDLSHAAFPVVVDPAMGPPDFTTYGADSTELFGVSFDWVGDVNGDGRDDIAVVAEQRAAVYLYYGSPSGMFEGTPWVHRVDGDDTTFEAVAGLGDVDGDGFADLGISSDWITGGELTVLRGGPSGPSVGSPPIPGIWWPGPAGDTDGDGFDDALLTQGFCQNFTQLHRGSSSGLSATAAWSYLTEFSEDCDYFGYAGYPFDLPETSYSYPESSGIGDVNGDGFDDVALGIPWQGTAFWPDLAPPAGEVLVFYGGGGGLAPTPDATLGFSDRSPFADWTIGSSFGAAITGLGDVDLDGFDDFAVGIPGYDGGSTNQGAVAVFQGSAAGPGAEPDSLVAGDQYGALFGDTVGGPGDVNGDGHVDMLVGAPAYDLDASDDSAVFLVLGTGAGWGDAVYGMSPGSNIAACHEGCQYSGSSGPSVAPGHGDANGDGLGDLAVGTPHFTTPEAWALGKLEVIAGSGEAFPLDAPPDGEPSEESFVTDAIDLPLIRVGEDSLY